LARTRSGAAELVLQVEERRFRELVENLVRNVLTMRFEELSRTRIYLGSVALVERGYSVRARLTYCKRYGGRGTVSVTVGVSSIELRVECSGTPPVPPARHGTALIDADRQSAYTTPGLLYGLYRLLYRNLGTGADPLLWLAREARGKGDAEVAGVLERLHAVLEASGGIVEEVEREDLAKAVADEVEGRVEESVHLLRAAKEAAKRGDTRRLEALLGMDVITAPGGAVRVTLGDILRYLAGERVGSVEWVLNYPVIVAESELALIDIYGVFVEAAEHLNLGVQRAAWADV